jgi:HK97 family phage prohead protease
MEKEKRVYNTKIEIRSDDGNPVVRGYAAVFNSESNDLGGFIELIDEEAFKDVLNDDVRALIDHESRYILGRTTSGTLRIGTDERGLWYEYDSPNTSYANDLMESMKRGDITQSSFGFVIAKDGDEWERKGETTYRTIKKIDRLFDVSPVTYPAYPDTSVAMRSLNSKSAILEADKVDRDKILRQIEINNYE